jgi:hypothetical protein
MAFALLFCSIQIVLGLWFLRAKKHKSKLEKEEKIFLKNLTVSEQTKVTNINLKNFNYRVRM